MKFTVQATGPVAFSVDSQPVTCSTLVPTGEAPEPLDSPGATGVRQDGDSYHVNWQTDPAAVTRFEDEAAEMQSLIFGTFSNGAILQDVLIDTSNPQQYTVIYSASFVD